MKLLIIFITAIIISANTSQPTFCDCWQEGYVEGYCIDQPPNACLHPAVPPCPPPPAGRNSCKDGYNLGVKEGVKDYADRYEEY